ncbi:hypothetical protein [Symbiopectobacterium purcellii]|uniref:Uncharacterized protein n=1 Tax=Symbiopectobacterium purcellii TaxID=2871826 RepID=A0ABX9ALG9_9ENTR|nr:hypothetical protein [Symbiopectobacterium purcellii]QZN94911.1 hypothetical protein K6K13_16895 [Symbiopectobacterium purcellii]
MKALLLLPLQLVFLPTLFFSVLLLPEVAIAKAQPVNNDQIKQAIIDESIAAYSGNCPCPYHSARNGSSCGKRSAWSRPGGYSPICYKNEVTQEMIDTWKKRHKS